MSKPKQKNKIAKRFKKRFSPRTEVPVKNITLKPVIFQGRSVPFAKATVEKIVREGYDTSQEPIVLYRMKKKGKPKYEDIVISGHSRFEAAKRLKLKTIPVKYFKGKFEDAVDYAVIESNRSGNAEGIESDIKAYIRAKQRGYNKDFMRSIFKSDSYIDNLRQLSYLNPQGMFIENLAKTSGRSFPYLERNAIWVGNLRMQYDKLTNKHEKELWDFFYNTKNGISVKKESLFRAVAERVNSSGFSGKKSLRLTKTSDFDHISKRDPGYIAYKSQLAQEQNMHERHKKLLRMSVEVLKRGEHKFADKLKKEASELREQIRAKRKTILELYKDLEIEDKRLSENTLF